MRNDPEAIPRVVMVDQLWLWILDESVSAILASVDIIQLTV